IDAGANASGTLVDASVSARSLPPLCARPGEDRVKRLFCGEEPPVIEGLRALQQALGFDYNTPLTNPLSPARVATVQGLSTALSARIISPINPRVIILASGGALAFQRGVQQVEIVVPTTAPQQLAFYLVRFAQACNGREQGCVPGDLYTPSVEAEWLSVSVEDDEDLKNTPADCRQCHQRGRERPTLLMRELEAPWTHFFSAPADAEGTPPAVTGEDLADDYVAAHGSEVYAGVPPQLLLSTVGFFLEDAVPRAQPLLFDAPRIEDERWPLGPSGTYPDEPVRSPTWDRAYEAFGRGEQLALPHYEVRPTDPSKQARLTEAYRAYRDGTLPASELPDLSDIFPDDPVVRAELGLQTEPGTAPADALIQACGTCHNDVLDQSISRARFNIDLARMSKRERAIAIERLQLSPDREGVMPPGEARQLDRRTATSLIEYLQQDAFPQADLERLRYAAEQGMTGGGLVEFSPLPAAARSRNGG
ncbi:MAG: hypothetical protein OXU20_27885, partial [Myxococcales bacterium]|nr:hypothetical protein [Myxococcales bacterium]